LPRVRLNGFGVVHLGILLMAMFLIVIGTLIVILPITTAPFNASGWDIIGAMVAMVGVALVLLAFTYAHQKR